MQKFYVDTSVWRDYFEDRKDNIRPLGEFAFRFLKKCLNRKELVLVSSIVVSELLVHYSAERVQQVFSNFKEIIVEINYSQKESEEALSFWIKTGKRFPFQDVLHSIIARDNDAVLISRDKHFEEIELVETRLPEEID